MSTERPLACVSGWARWRADGRELFYVGGGSVGGVGPLMAVEFRATDAGPQLGQAMELFDNEYLDPGSDRGGTYYTYAVSRDGQRFLIPRSASSTRTSAMPDPIVVVVNWASTLKP